MAGGGKKSNGGGKKGNGKKAGAQAPANVRQDAEPRQASADEVAAHAEGDPSTGEEAILKRETNHKTKDITVPTARRSPGLRSQSVLFLQVLKNATLIQKI
jgi:hypothetical protein